MCSWLASWFRATRVIGHCHAPRRLLSHHTKTYQEAFAAAVTNPREFWAEHAEKLVWHKKWDHVLTNPDSPFPDWFHGGLINITYNCLDRHVNEGHGMQTAIIQESPITGSRAQYSYETLLDQVTHLAGYLSRQCGVQKGDRVLIYMPMITECLIAMMAAARIGAIHVVVFGGFSAAQLGVRIRNAQPKVIITASYGVEPKGRIAYKANVDEALHLSTCADGVKRCIFFQRPNLPRVDLGNDDLFVDWGAALSLGQPHDAVPVEASHPLYLIYTSGTTGDPKGIVRDTGGYAVALKYTADQIYDIRPDDVWWACSEFGWVVGHSYCGYAPLLQRATSILYEGKPVGTPNAAQFFRVAAENKVNGWFLTPSAVRAIRTADPELVESRRYRSDECNLDNLRNMFVAGEHCDQHVARWLLTHLPPTVRLTDTWWQTETGWPITSSCLNYRGGVLNDQGLASPEGSAGLPVPGYNVQLVDQVEGNTSSQSIDTELKSPDGSKEVPLKRILVKLPMPPGTVSTLWNDDNRFKELYFSVYPGHFDTMDLGYQDDKGFVYILSRADDVINVSGHRLSTVALEEACLAVPDVVDCAVIAIPHEVKGHAPLAVIVLRPDSKLSMDAAVQAVKESVRTIVGPVGTLANACVVPRLPKTRSGKISRASLADMASGKPVRIPITIEDSSVYHPIYEAFVKAGLKASPVSLAN